MMEPLPKDSDTPTKCSKIPLKVLNGSPGYIALLDALNGWQVAKELFQATRTPASASFNHVLPSGVAIGLPLNKTEAKQCGVEDLMPLSRLATSYARARGADRFGSYGDFVAISHVCDLQTAKVLSREISDGIIAAGYDDEALEVLSKKKSGNYCIVQMDPEYSPAEDEAQSVFGLKLRQRRPTTTTVPGSTSISSAAIAPELFQKNYAEAGKSELPSSAVTDLIVASIALKYTNSNSIAFAYNGQVIGLGTGEETGLENLRLAGEKAQHWWLRHHPRNLTIPFSHSLKRAQRSGAVDAFAHADSMDQLLAAYPDWKELFDPGRKIPVPLNQDEKDAWMKKLKGAVMASDAYILDTESIDTAKNFGIQYITCPGGCSHDDQRMKEYAEALGITLICTGIRLPQP